ncbi:MAG: GYD domain superfamily [Armatimonadetes bacterium RBG_16_67_12]|nr:MAG: GYD domain superfamily [Armatimonadetes bacterium RBG_16_67_12]
MGTYLMLSNLTDDGAETVKKHPERIKEVNKEVEAHGVKILSQYAVLGPFDFATILEAPNAEVVARVSIELGARGSVRIQTLQLIPIDQFIAGVKT